MKERNKDEESMTTIIAIEEIDGVTLAWDSTASQSGEAFEIDGSKLFVNNGNVFLLTGHLGDVNVLRYADLPSYVDGSVDSTYCKGSGGDYARGALAAGATTLNAINIASRYDTGTGGKAHLTTAGKALQELNQLGG